MIVSRDYAYFSGIVCLIKARYLHLVAKILLFIKN